MMEKPERQPYVHWTTCYDYRGDVDYRRVFVFTVWSTLRIRPHLTAESLPRRLYCLLRKTC